MLLMFVSFYPILTSNYSHRGWCRRRAPNLSASWISAGTTTRSRRLPNFTASWFWRSSRRWSSSRRNRTATSQLRPGLASMSSRKHLLQAGVGKLNNWVLPVREQIGFFNWFVRRVMWRLQTLFGGVWENNLDWMSHNSSLGGKKNLNPNMRPFSLCLFLLILHLF